MFFIYTHLILLMPIQKATFWDQFKTSSEVNRNKKMLKLLESESIFHSLYVLHYLHVARLMLPIHICQLKVRNTIQSLCYCVDIILNAPWKLYSTY